MVYVPPLYPTTIPTITDLPNRVDDVDWLEAARYNELKKELRAVQTELGTLPKGIYASVKARLDTAVVGATKALDNLAAVAINTSLISDTNDTDDLGSATKKWKDGHFAGKMSAGNVENYGAVSRRVNGCVGRNGTYTSITVDINSHYTLASSGIVAVKLAGYNAVYLDYVFTFYSGSGFTAFTTSHEVRDIGKAGTSAVASIPSAGKIRVTITTSVTHPVLSFDATIGGSSLPAALTTSISTT